MNSTAGQVASTDELALLVTGTVSINTTTLYEALFSTILELASMGIHVPRFIRLTLRIVRPWRVLQGSS